jgi:hypothetical protein
MLSSLGKLTVGRRRRVVPESFVLSIRHHCSFVFARNTTAAGDLGKSIRPSYSLLPNNQVEHRAHYSDFARAELSENTKRYSVGRCPSLLIYPTFPCNSLTLCSLQYSTKILSVTNGVPRFRITLHDTAGHTSIHEVEGPTNTGPKVDLNSIVMVVKEKRIDLTGFRVIRGY